jgi:hypothetical protein
MMPPDGGHLGQSGRASASARQPAADLPAYLRQGPGQEPGPLAHLRPGLRSAGARLPGRHDGRAPGRTSDPARPPRSPAVRDRRLTVDNLRQLPTITWTGKGHKPRRVIAGRALSDALTRYLAAYPDSQPASPLICRQVIGAARQGGPRRLDWHRPASNRTLFYVISERAKATGLGHVAPILRREARPICGPTDARTLCGAAPRPGRRAPSAARHRDR